MTEKVILGDEEIAYARLAIPIPEYREEENEKRIRLVESFPEDMGRQVIAHEGEVDAPWTLAEYLVVESGGDVGEVATLAAFALLRYMHVRDGGQFLPPEKPEPVKSAKELEESTGHTVESIDRHIDSFDGLGRHLLETHGERTLWVMGETLSRYARRDPDAVALIAAAALLRTVKPEPGGE